MSEPEVIYWSQPNQQVVRDGDPVAVLPDDPDPELAGFDPADHTVAEVEQYLDDNPDERDRVLEAEAAGKARRSLLGDEYE